MPVKRSATAFHVSLISRKNIGREIYEQISSAMRDGRLSEGERLTSSRELARALSVSRMTVNGAYERLMGEGLVETRRGEGTFVAQGLRPTPKVNDTAKGTALLPLDHWHGIPAPLVMDIRVRFDFRTGLPDLAQFPREAWRKAQARALDLGYEAGGGYADPSGSRRLRDAIARHIGFSRGVVTGADQILITSGTQQALALVARVLLKRGQTIAVEDPGYGVPRLLFNSMGLRVVGVPVDREGIIVHRLPRAARAVYVTPSHQFPLSVTMSHRRRVALLEWARRNDAAIFEDDYDSEFRFDGRPCEALQTMDPDGRVIYVGSFSKSLFPGLRVGFLAAPSTLVESLRKAKFLEDWHTASPVQDTLAAFVEEGGFARHVRRMTRLYAVRRQLMQEIVPRDFGGHLDLVQSSVGLHLTTLVREGREKAEEVARRAAECGIAVQVSRSHPAKASLPTIMTLGYGAIATADVRPGLALLRECFG